LFKALLIRFSFPLTYCYQHQTFIIAIGTATRKLPDDLEYGSVVTYSTLRRKSITSFTKTLRGLTTVSFWVADLAAAKKWYAELLGIAPYFERQGYAEFRLSDYQHELGLIDSR
jgi:hypothetical protein